LSPIFGTASKTVLQNCQEVACVMHGADHVPSLLMVLLQFLDEFLILWRLLDNIYGRPLMAEF